MLQDTCAIDDCHNARYQKRDFCGSHFMRAYRYGDPLYVPQRRQPTDLRGRSFGRLVVIEWRQGRWLCRCECGKEVLTRSGDLNRGSARSCGAKRHRRRSDISYATAHDRTRRDRGSAAEYACIDCGRPAVQWSYDHADPDERVESGMPYSITPSHYDPRCISCHRRYDLAYLAAHKTNARVRGA